MDVYNKQQVIATSQRDTGFFDDLAKELGVPDIAGWLQEGEAKKAELNLKVDALKTLAVELENDLKR